MACAVFVAAACGSMLDADPPERPIVADAGTIETHDWLGASQARIEQTEITFEEYARTLGRQQRAFELLEVSCRLQDSFPGRRTTRPRENSAVTPETHRRKRVPSD